MDIEYLKSVMVREGFLQTPSPGLDWLESEERAWQQVCAFTGLHYTPFPSRENQDPYWIDLIDRKQLILKKQQVASTTFMNPRDLLPGPTKFVPDTPAHVMRKHATLLDPELPKEEASKYPHAKKLTAKFTRAVLKDPLENLEPNPIARRRPAVRKAQADKSQKLNKVLSEAPSRDPTKPIRVQ
jgi:hypothetical protein